MKTPETFLHDLLGDLRTVTILDREVDLYDMVSIDPADDLADLLRNHPLLAITWERLKDRCAARLAKVKATLEEVRGQRFVAYYTTHEDEERKELEKCVYDEDMFLPEDRRKAMAQRIAKGEKAPARWRRNFSDALINHFVNCDPNVHDAETVVRQAQNEYSLADSVVKVLEHRRWCLTYLVSLQKGVDR